MSSDLLHRLRDTAVPTVELCGEAAGEIERLRLTDAEREAIRRAILSCEADIGLCSEQANIDAAQRDRAILMALLDRTK